MKIKQLALILSIFAALHGLGQTFKFSEFSFSNPGLGNPSDPLAAGQYKASPDWVEIYNNTSNATPQAISGWYLSDDRTNLRKWQIPTAISGGGPILLDSHNVVVIYLCEHDKAINNPGGVNAGSIQIDLHANFSCNQTKPGTKIYLTKINSYTAVDSIDVFRFKNKPGHSWGREFKQIYPHWVIPSTWRLYQTPSPGAVNPFNANPLVTPNWFIDYCPTPVVDLQPGFYSGGLPTLNVSDTTRAFYNTYGGYPNVEIYGTNDCSIPVYNNGAAQLVASAGTQGTGLTGTFSVPNFANTPVSMVRLMTRDASVPKRYLDGFEFYGAYIDDSLKYKMSLTCICVDTTKLFLTTPAKDSTPMIIHHFDKTYADKFKNQGQGMVSGIDFFNPVGSNAMRRKQWQFVFRSEDEYGYHYTNTDQFYTDPLLGYSNRSDFPSILFRSAADENFLFPGGTGTNGYQGAHVRDFYNHTISLRHNLRYDASRYTPTYVVINGVQKGIYYIKETIDSLWTNYYYNRPKAAILANSPAGTQVTVAGLGTPTAQTQWNWFYSWAMNTTTNVHIPQLYYRISDSLDFNSLNDYMIYNMLSVNADYVKRNAMWWKGLPTDTADHREAKWRFALTNTDYTWGFDYINSSGLGNTSPTSDPCDYMLSAGLTWTVSANPAPNASYPIIPLWYKLMKNDTFKSEFITRYSDLLNSALSCDSLKDHLKYIRTKLATGDMNSHVWWNLADPNGGCNVCDSVHYWNAMLDSMNVFLAQRCTLVNQGLTNCFPEITGPYNLCIDVSPAGTGYVQLNSLTLKNFVWNGKYFDSIINVIKAYPYSNYVFDHWEPSNNIQLSPSNSNDSATFYLPSDGCVKAIFKLRPAYETYGTPMLPTGFSPNNDGNNDILNVYGTADASNYELEVFNRWGEQVFHSEDKTAGWDGKFNGADAPAGIYAYRFNIIINGKTFKGKGNVTLVR